MSITLTSPTYVQSVLTPVGTVVSLGYESERELVYGGNANWLVIPTIPVPPAAPPQGFPVASITSGTINGTAIGAVTPATISGTTGSFSGNVVAGPVLATGGAATIPVVARAGVSQTANLFQAQDVNGTVLAAINGLGNLTVNSGRQVQTTNNAAAVIVITPPASTVAYQNTSGYPMDVVVAGGTVTAIAFSRDNVTYYSTGLITGVVSLSPNDYLKITYTVAPTVTGVPR